MAEQFDELPAPGLVMHGAEEESLGLVLGWPPAAPQSLFEDRVGMPELPQPAESPAPDNATFQIGDATGEDRQALYTACLETLWTLALN